MNRKRRSKLSKRKKGEIAAALLKKLPALTQEEMRTMAQETKIPVSQIKAVVGA